MCNCIVHRRSTPRLTKGHVAPNPWGPDCPTLMGGVELTRTARSTGRSSPRTASGSRASCGSVGDADELALDDRHSGMAPERCGTLGPRKGLWYVVCVRASTAAVGTNFHLLPQGVATDDGCAVAPLALAQLSPGSTLGDAPMSPIFSQLDAVVYPLGWGRHEDSCSGDPGAVVQARNGRATAPLLLMLLGAALGCRPAP